MSEEKISVVVPFFNSELTLNSCLKSIFKSTYRNFEVIAISDHSTDKSDEIAKKYNCKFKRLKKNYGSGYARNVGSKLAKGKILLFVDSDVVIKKNALNLINNHFKKKGNYLAQGIYDHKINYKKISTQYLQSYQCYYIFSKEKKYIENMVSNFLSIRKKIFFDVGGFDGKFKGSNAEDADLGYRIQKKGFKIPILRNLNSKHLVNFGIIQFLNKLSRIHVGEMKMFLRNKNIGSKIKQTNYLPVIITIVLLGLQIITVSCYFFLKDIPLFAISIILNISILITQFNFLKFIQFSKNFLIMLKCIPLMYLHSLIFIYCFLWGIADFYIFKNKY